MGSRESGNQGDHAGTGQVESLYQQVRRDLLAVMVNKPRIANQAIFLSRSAYNLRRAAERVTGICEWVVFAVEGFLGAAETPPEIPVRQPEKRFPTP